MMQTDQSAIIAHLFQVGSLSLNREEGLYQ
jgi:hypothetical protein